MQRRARPLTAGEIAMASTIFGEAIDYDRVRVHNRPYLPLGLQPRHCAMSPNGSIYFHHSCFLADYSAAAPAARHWFMHEMVHVWQHQLGYPVRLRGAVRLGLSYRYVLREGAALCDFNMEAQGELLADYFALRHLGRAEAMSRQEYAGSLALLESVLSGFLRDPSNAAHLPRGTAARLLRGPHGLAKPQ